MKEKLRILIGTIMLVVLIATTVVINNLLTRKEESNLIVNLDPEIQRAMTYEQFRPGDENIQGTDNVKFSAFFLRDIDGDGYADKIKGTCKEIGEKDTLYMEIVVQSEGYVKNGKIEINGKNFDFGATLPKDGEIKKDYLGNQITEIEFNDLQNGIQKLVMGTIHSGIANEGQKNSALKHNINNYSRNDNKIIFSGIYVKGNGEEISFQKIINLSVDWYGIMYSTIYRSEFVDYIETCINEEEDTFTTKISIYPIDHYDRLFIKSNHIEGSIPEFNGYKPLRVSIDDNNIEFSYNEETSTYTIDRNAIVGSTGYIEKIISNDVFFTIDVVYPLEAYRLSQEEEVEFRFPVSSYFIGFNNPNSEFENPYKSNNYQTIIRQKYRPEPLEETQIDVVAGKLVKYPSNHYSISKRGPLRIYNEYEGENEKEDTYIVKWSLKVGKVGDTEGVTFKETKDGESQKVDTFVKSDNTEESMEDVLTNVGIYFSGLRSTLGEDGFVKVYDDETGTLIHTFTSADWGKYNEEKPYMYEFPIKHIRVVTSNIELGQNLEVINIKRIDDEILTQKYSREEFDDFKKIKTNIVVYIGDNYYSSKSFETKYEDPSSIATIGKSQGVISTQKALENVDVTIKCHDDSEYNTIEWKNGIHLIKFPKEIIDVKINDVSINNTSVVIDSFELIESDDGKLIRIRTSNDEATNYTITINMDLVADPRISTRQAKIYLYSINKEEGSYYFSGEDIYDVDDDGDKTEITNVYSTGISILSPNSLITNQTISEFDDNNSLVISPQIAELKPIYDEGDIEKQKIKIGAHIKNNYTFTISEIVMLGKIPFQGNTYVLSGGNLKSEFSTTMTSDGLIVPDELINKVKVYYSTNENPTKDLLDYNNGWMESEDVENWDDIKTWLVDFDDEILEAGAEYTFYYIVEIPFEADYNQISYSHHGIYFCYDTEQGKLRAQIEPNKIGVMIADKYNLIIKKYQKNKEKLVQGAVYKISKLDEEENIIESQTAVTNADGCLEMANLYAENVYKIEEIYSPDDYDLNDDIVKIIGHVDRKTGELSVEKVSGTIKDSIQIIKNLDENYKAKINVEDEVKATIVINKYSKGTDTKLTGAKYKIRGTGLGINGKNIVTKSNGEAILSGLKIGEEYVITEFKAPNGYYLNEKSITIKILNDIDTGYKLYIKNEEGTYTDDTDEILNEYSEIRNISYYGEDDIPIYEFKIDDEKIPTYNLRISKIRHRTEIISGEEHETIEIIEGAKFRLYKGKIALGTFITDMNGELLIENLYQYVEEKDVDQTYTLKEIYAPEGYSVIKDMNFKVYKDGNELKFEELMVPEGNEKDYYVDGNTINLVLEDSPIFKLVKTDEETGERLPNTKFAIYNIDKALTPAKNSKGETIGEKETIDGKEYNVVTTDSNGEISLDLPQGIYKAVEVQACDPKYDIKDKEYYFGIGENRDGYVSIKAQWAEAIGGNLENSLETIIQTSDGGYVLGGRFTGNIVIRGTELTSNGGEDGLIIKLDSDREIEWIRTFGGAYEDYVKTITETSDGGYIVGGNNYNRNATVGETIITNKGDYDGLLIKYSQEGDMEWVKSIGSNGRDCIESVSATNDGGFIVGGYFNSTSIDIDGETINRIGSTDGMVIKYNSAGNVEWTKVIGGTNDDKVESISETLDGGYLLAGNFYSTTIEIEGETLNKIGYNDSYIIKYNEFNEKEWIKQIGNEQNSNYIYSIIETADEGFIIGGSFNNVSIYDYAISGENCIVKYNKEGTIEWGDKVAGKVSSMSLADDGGLLVGGYFTNSTNVGQYELNSDGNKDGMFIKYKECDAPKVAVKEAISFGGEGREYFDKIIETPDEGYLIIGSYDSNITIDGYTLINNGEDDAMILKYNKEGQIEWINTFGNDKDDVVESVACTSDGGYLVGGYTRGYVLDFGNDVGIELSGNNKAILVKYDAYGNAEWVRNVGGEINCIEQTKDGGILIGVDCDSTIRTLEGYSVSCNREGQFMIKYDENFVVEWIRKVSEDMGNIEYAIETSDGGYLVAVYHSLRSGFYFDDIFVQNKGRSDTGELYFVKYNSERGIEWIQNVGGNYSESAKGLKETANGDYIAIVTTSSTTIYVGDYATYGGTYGYSCGLVIRFSPDGEITNAIKYPETHMYGLEATEDGGYVVGQYTSSRSSIGKYFTGNGGNYVVKYDTYDGIEWIKKVPDVKELVETNKGEYLVIGTFTDEKTIDNYTLISKGLTDSMIIRLGEERKIPKLEELNATNNLKTFKITTEVDPIDGIKGGTISGEFLKIFEEVKYGYSTAKSIVITPDENYEIISITANGEEVQFIPEADGTYTLPPFVNVTEDIHIVVQFSLKDNKITINKTDNITGESLEGAIFKLDQIDERADPENVVGELVDNGETYYLRKSNEEVTGVLGELTSNGTYYFVEQDDGTYIPTNSKTWQVANVEGATEGVRSSTAYSYIPIDLSNLTGHYKVVVNAAINCERYEYGFARVTTNTSALGHSYETGRFIHEYGTVYAKDYESGIILEGGNTYYLHLGYSKDSVGDVGSDWIKINSVKVYEYEEKVFNFIVNSDGKYESTNKEYNVTTCTSYVPIDLTNYTGKYNVTINTYINGDGNDYGYATISESKNRVYHDTTNGVIRMVHTNNSYYKDFTAEVDGGKIYYLHLGYYKSYNYRPGYDRMLVNSITVTRSGSELYHTTLESNSLGKAMTQIPFGKYAVTEIEAPEGYYTNDSIPDIEFRSYDGAIHEFTVADEKKDYVIVHHYKKGTTEKVAEDVIIEGHGDDNYSTDPIIDLPRYKLEETDDGYVLPSNRTGTYTYEDIEVNYYYVPREVPLTVHHYIDGTLNGVPLANGDIATDVTSEGNEGETYTTEAIDSSLLNPKYELLREPDNKEGTFEYDGVVVTYNYRVKNSAGYVVHHVNKITGEKIAEDEMVSGGKYGDSYTTNESNDIPANYTYDSKSDNWEGTLVDSLTEVTYYYLTTSESKTLDINKESTTTLINDKNQAIDYKITYNGTIDEYIGRATIRIVDRLPYRIDESLSNLNGGIYNDEEKTITWEDAYAGIDTYSDGLYTIRVIKNISLVYKDIVLEDSELSNNVYGYLETYIDGDPHLRTTTKELNIPQEIKGKVIVKYLDKKTEEEIAEEVIHSAKIGTDFDVSDDVKVISGYELVEEPQEKTGTYTEADQEKVYKYSKKISYTVEYYYDGVKDETKTETKEGLEETSVDNYTNNVIDGYKFDKTENLPLTLDRNEDNIIKVYYVKDNFGYSVEYYYDGTKDDSKTEVKSAAFESTIDTYDDKVIDGYKLDREVGLPLTITSDTDDNVIKIFYVKDSFDYSIEYYFNGVKDDTLTETDSALFGTRIEDYTDKVRTGYIFSKTENLPLIITSNPDNNIIKIYYIIDDGQTKQLFYKIEYYKDEELQEGDTKRITNRVQLLDPDTLEVNSVEVLEEDKYLGYEIDRTEPEAIPSTINTGETIKVFYKKRNDIGFKVVYKDKDSKLEIAEAGEGKGTYQDRVKSEDYIKDIPGYEYDYCVEDEIILSAIDDENIITILYKKKNNLSYKVHYLDKDTNKELKEVKTVDNQIYLDEIDSEDEVVDIDGYEYDSADVETLIIKDDISLNNINLYYKKRNDLSYSVKYVDKEDGKEISERKTVNNRTFGEVIDTASEVIEISKYNYDSISSDSITIGTDNNEIIIYYTKKEGNLIIRFIDQISGEEIAENSTIKEKIDTKYEVKEKDIDGYVYIESFGNKKGTIKEEDQEVIFYYRKAAKVIIRYLDSTTNEEVEDRKVISGYVGKTYETTQKDINGYKYSQRSDNYTGQMTEEDTEIVYSYKRESKVIVKYINSYTNEVIETEEKTYVEGDEYNTIPKDISGYDIDETKVVDNKAGTIGREDVEVKIYYKEKATLLVEYVDEKDNKIVNDKEKDVHIGDNYEVDKILIDGYNFRGMPDNYKGTIENKNTVVKLVYDKIYSDDSKADTTIPKTMDKDMTKAYILIAMGIVFTYSTFVVIRLIIIKKKKNKFVTGK